MIIENHNVIAYVVFCFRLSTCQKTDTCKILGYDDGSVELYIEVSEHRRFFYYYHFFVIL